MLAKAPYNEPVAALHLGTQLIISVFQSECVFVLVDLSLMYILIQNYLFGAAISLGEDVKQTCIYKSAKILHLLIDALDVFTPSE